MNLNCPFYLPCYVRSDKRLSKKSGKMTKKNEGKKKREKSEECLEKLFFFLMAIDVATFIKIEKSKSRLLSSVPK